MRHTRALHGAVRGAGQRGTPPTITGQFTGRTNRPRTRNSQCLNRPVIAQALSFGTERFRENPPLSGPGRARLQPPPNQGNTPALVLSWAGLELAGFSVRAAKSAAGGNVWESSTFFFNRNLHNQPLYKSCEGSTTVQSMHTEPAQHL